MNARQIAATVLSIVAAATGSVAATAPAVAEPAAASSITWTPCPENPAVSCGRLELPIDWSGDASKGTFQLAVAKRPATDPANRIGTLFVNPGGPGGSGVSFAIGAPSFLSPDLLKRFDIIGIDPRGVARSQQLVCSSEALDLPGSTALPTNQTEFDRLVAYNRRVAQDCREQSGPLFDHVDSVAVARDMDAVRAALGEDKISWYGVSYGTLIGQMYAELFPNRLRALVNDSNMDHSLGTRAFVVSEASFVEDSWDQFVKWCAQSTNCGVHGDDVDALWERLKAKADAGTLTDPADGHVVDIWELLATAEFLFSRPRWNELGAMLKDLRDGLGLPVQPERTAALVPDVRAQFCEEWHLPVKDFATLDRLWKQSNEAAPRMRTSPNAWLSLVQCIGWPGRVNNPQHPLNVANTPRLLMLNGIHDPATGYDWALNVLAQLKPKATLVTYLGSGHGVYPRNACTRGSVDAYLTNLTVPQADATCPASDPPLAPAAVPGAPEPRRWAR